MNKKCMGYIDTKGGFSPNELLIIILTTKEYYNTLTAQRTVIANDAPKKTNLYEKTDSIKIYERYGSYTNICYIQLLLNLKNLEPLPSQQIIVDGMLNLFRKKGKVTAFIEGVPGSGKSFIGYLLAKEIGGSFCHSFNPTDPGNTFSQLINRIRDYDSIDNDNIPIIIVLEEIDVLIDKIHNQKLVLNNTISTSVQDKSSWSTFLDDMFLYQNIILILTTNKTKQDIDKIDPAYLRKGRVDQFYKMDESIDFKTD